MTSAWVAPTWTLPKLSGASTPGAASRYTFPVTLVDWLTKGVKPRPLVPIPSEVKLTVTLPLCEPTALVDNVSDIAALLPPDASRPTDPLGTSPPVTLPKLASNDSLQPSLAAVLAIVNTSVPGDPTCMLKVVGPNAGCGKAVDAAGRNADGLRGQAGRSQAAGSGAVASQRHRDRAALGACIQVLMSTSSESLLPYRPRRLAPPNRSRSVLENCHRIWRPILRNSRRLPPCCLS